MDSFVICDTNIFIAAYKQDESIVHQLKLIGQDSIAFSAVTASELIYGALDKNDLRRILLDTQHLQLFHIDVGISELHVALMERYALSHNLTLADAIIAATAIRYDLPLYTLNLKDFRYIENLKLYQP